MRIRGTCRYSFAATLAGIAWAGVASAAEPATMRLDYFHTGGQGTEVFSVDRVVVEPLPWPGHSSRNVDPTQGGTYRFEVRSPEGTVLYARGYGSIYGEWIVTEEATERHRTFSESVRFPAPQSPVDVVIFDRDADLHFREIWRTRIDPVDPFIDRSAPPPQTVVPIEQHGAPHDKVDLLLLGDGYTAIECARKFPLDARRMTDALFAHEPFASRRAEFNVWGLCPPALESGISRPSTGQYRDSPVGATYDAFGSERYVLTFENRRMREVAAWAPYEVLEILVNGETYGGGGIYNLFSTVAVDNDWAEYVFVHEFGHHFAALADEYYTSPVAYQPPDRIVEPWEPNVTVITDPAKLKWKDLVTRGTPLPTPWPKAEFETHEKDFQARRKEIRAQNRPEAQMSALFREERAFTTTLFRQAAQRNAVGAFQGANYDANAYYRPQLDCIMFTRDPVPFCAVCRRALEAAIDSWVPAAGSRDGEQ
jgi:IgA Peptidase M64/Peptidase M64 N-terminus